MFYFFFYLFISFLFFSIFFFFIRAFSDVLAIAPVTLIKPKKSAFKALSAELSAISGDRLDRFLFSPLGVGCGSVEAAVLRLISRHFLLVLLFFLFSFLVTGKKSLFFFF